MTILVTGTSSGIGLQIAKSLVSKGQKVIGVARRATLINDPLFEQIKADVTDPAFQASLGQRTDITGAVLNHGGIEPIQHVKDAYVDQWKRGFDINFFSFVAIVKQLLPQLRKSNARLIFVSSNASGGGIPAWACYGATKAAVNVFAKTLAAEEPNITPISVSPGVVGTETFLGVAEKYVDVLGKGRAKMQKDLEASGRLTPVATSGKMYANLVLSAPKSLTGRYLSYGIDSELESYSN